MLVRVPRNNKKRPRAPSVNRLGILGLAAVCALPAVAAGVDAPEWKGIRGLATTTTSSLDSTATATSSAVATASATTSASATTGISATSSATATFTADNPNDDSEGDDGATTEVSDSSTVDDDPGEEQTSSSIEVVTPAEGEVLFAGGGYEVGWRIMNRLCN